jgi:hypothetical protein
MRTDSFVKTLHTHAGRIGGQAMIEFVVGLIAVLALFAGLLQIASLTRARTDTMVNARRNAAVRALMDPTLLSTPDYIEAIAVGPDGSSYSVDDTPAIGSPSVFVATTVDPSAADAAGWDLIGSAPGNAFTALRTSAAPMYDLQMVQGADRETVPVMPAVQHLMYDAASITVESQVWLPWIRGLY